MIKVGQINTLRIDRFVEFGAYLDDGDKGILLPKKYVPPMVDVDSMVDVFIYHDTDSKLIATTEMPKIQLGEIGYLKCESTTKQGAFMNWGLIKDLFVPKSQQRSQFYKDGYYFVKAYIDGQTGRIAASEKFDEDLINENCDLTEGQEVDLLVYRNSPMGYVCIVNGKYEGLIFVNEVFKPLYIGKNYKGFVKKINTENWNIDLGIGKKGYDKVQDETDKIMELLNDNDGYLPYNDKSAPEAIYEYFGMSKKVFKMTLGKLYKDRKIEFTQTGIKIV